MSRVPPRGQVIRLLPLTLSALILAGCAHAPTCGRLATTLERLKCDAAAGNKQAQLQLGMRYEAGDGVPRDRARAAHFYAKAARTQHRSKLAYSPAVGNERYGRLIPVGGAPTTNLGLPEARRRLNALRRSRSRAAAVQLCPKGWRPIAVKAVAAGRSLAINLTCKGDADTETRPAAASITLSGRSTVGPERRIILEPLFDPPTSGSQRIEQINSRRYTVRLVASGGPCPTLAAEALHNPPAPARYLDSGHRWNLSLDFLAAPDCSVILAFIGNQAVAIEPRVRGSARLYDILFRF